QPNARSAQTGEADKFMGRSADHDPTGWDALRSITSLSSLILALLTWWGASANHQPNARCAQTGEADKLMGRFADHDATGWDARAPASAEGARILYYGSIRWISYYC